MLIPITRAGIQIDVLDSSPGMLSILCNQLKGEAPEVRDRVLPYLQVVGRNWSRTPTVRKIKTIAL
jgi:hypothetical protein